MLQRDLKKIAYESVISPSNLSSADKVLLDVGSREYFVTRAMEHVASARSLKVSGSEQWHNHLREAIKLLILARVQG